MTPHNIAIVLENTSHPGNIGSTARAMKTMGLSDLRLANTVSPDHSDAYARASGADDIIYQAQRFSSIAEALADSHVVIGLSGRKRAQREPMLSTELHDYLANLPAQCNVAFLFGNEQNGLSNHALALCHQHVMIPANPKFRSLNLAASVQIIAYICQTQHLSPGEKVDDEPAHFAQVESLVQRLDLMLRSSGYPMPQDQDNLADSIRLALFKHPLNRKQTDLLHGIIKHLNQKIASS